MVFAVFFFFLHGSVNKNVRNYAVFQDFGGFTSAKRQFHHFDPFKKMIFFFGKLASSHAFSHPKRAPLELLFFLQLLMRETVHDRTLSTSLSPLHE